jgi:hypothetical protein
LTGWRDAIAPVGTRPPQWMRAVLLISTGSLSSHRFASSIDGSLAPSFNSTLFGDVMAATWVQENARWDGFPISHLGQLNSQTGNTLETTFSFFKLPLKFSDQIRKSKSRVPEETGGESLPGPPGPVGPGRPACLGRELVQSGFPCTLLISHFQPMRKDGLVKLREKLQKNKRKLFTKIHTLFYVLG